MCSRACITCDFPIFLSSHNHIYLFVCLFVVVFFLLIQKVINKYIYTYFSAVIMAQSTLILVAALLISTLSYCSAENVYCVTPTATSCSSCPHNSSHCATLSEYAQEAHLYFTSNTTMVFLPGDHVLHTNITVTSVARLIMHGESSSGNIVTIVCNGSVGLSFTSMVDFKIDSLAFTSCSRRYYVTPPGIPGWYTYISVHAALLLQYTQYAELVNCSFHHNHGTALVVNNTNITLENINFVQNHVYCKGDDNLGGGGIIATNSNLTFTGNTTFLDNRAFCGPLDYGVNGGAILAYGMLFVKSMVPLSVSVLLASMMIAPPLSPAELPINLLVPVKLSEVLYVVWIAPPYKAARLLMKLVIPLKLSKAFVA